MYPLKLCKYITHFKFSPINPIDSRDKTPYYPLSRIKDDTNYVLRKESRRR